MRWSLLIRNGTVIDGPIRYAAMGGENRAPTTAELDNMQSLLAEAMDAGAFGLSSGLVYAPSAFAETEELIALCRSMASRGGQYFTHMRGEAHTLLESIAEATRIAEEGGVPLQIAHLKAVGRENWPLFDRALELIDAGRGRGLDVTADVYPYAASSTFLSALLPQWVHDGGTSKFLERIANPTARSDSLGLSCGNGPHKGRPHPLMYGTFPRVLGRYVREGLFSLEQVVAKMTGQPAAKLGLRDRGLVREGCFADLVLFDSETVRDEATFAQPHCYPSGIPYVAVNGELIVDGGRFDARPTGRILGCGSILHS